MELKDTVKLMTSSDYKDRFKAEYYQLKIRYNKLLQMVLDWRADRLTFTPTCPINTYQIQIGAMSAYLHLLEARAIMEGIKLEVDDED